MGRRTIAVDGLGHGGQPIPVAVTLAGLLATGGVGGADRETGMHPAELADEVANVFSNIRAILAAAGASTDDVLKLTFFVSDRGTRDAINREWVAMFPDETDRPVRHTLVIDLPPGARVQAEMLATVTTGVAP